MGAAAPIQSNFGSGEFSPLLYGRVDSDRYKTALAKCLNYYPLLQGGLCRRSGTTFIVELKSSAAVCRLIPFEFSITQAYMIEVGNAYLRFCANYGQILSGGVPYEVVSPWATADLAALKFVQSADVLYVFHPNYVPRKISRTSSTSWTVTAVTFLDGPYLPLNATATTLTPSAFAVGAGVTITASATTGINGGTGFAATDVGRLIRIEEGTTWGWVQITAFTDTTHVTVTVQSSLINVNAKVNWEMGLYSATTGYPSNGAFHEDRLFTGGGAGAPERFDASRSSDYENLAPTNTDGTVTASHAFGYNLNANDVNVLRWMSSDEKALLMGTVGGEWAIRPSNLVEALSPTNISAKRSTAFGTANIAPVKAGKSSIYVQRAGKKVREMSYFFQIDGYQASDLSVLSEHITGTGLAEITLQKQPQPIVWARRIDGTLIGCTYERDLSDLKAGWHRHQIGGQSDAAGTAPIVESIAVIPSPDGTRDDLWMIVKRRINGGTKRYIEVLTKTFESTDLQENGVFVDASLTYDLPITVNSLTLANPGVITANTHGFSNGDEVIFRGCLGTTQLNNNTYLVTNATANTFRMTDLDGNVISTAAFTAYVGGGTVRKMVTTISGLDHLEGETINILADGAVQPAQAVATGAITLTIKAATVTIGLGYNSDMQQLRLEAGSQVGTALGKTRRIHRVGILVYRSLGLKIGMNFDTMDTVTFRTSANPGSRAVPLYSGILDQNIDADYDFDNQLCIRQSDPLPSLILGIFPQLVTNDRL